MNKESNSLSLDNKKSHPIRKWVFLSISILINAFIIVNAALPADISGQISNFFYNIVKSIANSISGDVSKTIPVSDVTLTYNDDYGYAHISGYKDNEIPLGISKSLKAAVLPDNATDKGVKFTIDDTNKGTINTDGNNVYITGKSIGDIKVTATSASDNTKVATYDFKVVDLIAPVSFDVPETTLSIYNNSMEYLPISVSDKSECYDINKLIVTSNDNNIVTISNGVITSHNVGNTSINVSNGTINKSFNVEVKDTSEVIYPISGWSIEGDNKLHIGESTDLSIKWVEGNDPTIKSMMWSTSDEYLASVDNDGKVIINHKRSNEVEKVTITATSKIDASQSVTFDIEITNYDVDYFELVIPYYGNHVTDGKLELEKTDIKQIWLEFPWYNVDRRVTITSSDASVATGESKFDDHNQNYLYITALKEGTTRIIVTSVARPDLSHYVDITVVPKGAINNGNSQTIKTIIRKVFGHGLLFFISGLFTLLFFNDLFSNKKRWLKYVVTLGIGIVIALISELIQVYAPGRSGDMKDVLIDLAGYIFAMLILFVIWFIKYKKNNKKKIDNN